MKRLMVAAALMALGGLNLQADTEIDSVNFNDRDPGTFDWTLSERGEGYDTLWSRGDGVTEIGDNEVKVYATPPTSGNTQYLKIDESGVLARKLADDAVTIPGNGGIRISSRVQFTAQDAEDTAPEVASGSKIALWAQIGEGVTNLMVTAGRAIGDTTKTNIVTNFKLSNDKDAWYDLVVKAENVVVGGETNAVFMITVNNEAVKSGEMTMFQSLVGFGEKDYQTIASLGFKGTGAADELKFVSYENETAIEVTLTFDPMESQYALDDNPTYAVDGGAKTSFDPATGFSILPSQINESITIEANADGYKPYSKTYTKAEFVESKGALTIKMEPASEDPTEIFITDIQNAEEGDTVTATGDIALTAALTIGKGITIDLNGNTLTSTATEEYAFELGANTIVVSNGTISVSATRGFHTVGGVLTFEDVTATCAGRVVGAYAGAAVAVAADAVLDTTGDDVTVFIRGNTVDKSTEGTKAAVVVNGTVKNTGTYYAISGNGWDWLGADVTVNEGAVVSAANELAIFHPDAGTLTVNGGTITGKTGIYAKSGTVTISGGKITGNGTAVDPTVNNNGATNTGDALVLEKLAAGDGGYAGNITCTITGGTFTSANGLAVRSWARTGQTALAAFITGGTFNTKPADALLAKNYWAETVSGGYEVKAMLKYYAKVYLDGDELGWGAGLGTNGGFYAKNVDVVVKESGVRTGINPLAADKTYFVSKLVLNGATPTEWLFDYNGTTITQTNATEGVTISENTNLTYTVTTGDLACFGAVYFTEYVAKSQPVEPGNDGTEVTKNEDGSVTIEENKTNPGEASITLNDTTTTIKVSSTIDSVTVAGETPAAGQIKVLSSDGTDITDYCKMTTEGKTIDVSLDEDKVTPTVTESSEEGKTIADGSVATETIKGLTYTLQRWKKLGDDTTKQQAAQQTGTGSTMTLTDEIEETTKPSAAFYRIEVSK